MRHGKKINHLGRTASHRKAMLSNMAASLIKHKRIKTTVAKAKALRKYVEPLLTKSKTDTTHSRRVVFSYLQDKEAAKVLFDEVAAKIAERPGGYTRIIRMEQRAGDNAEMCLMELVDFNELMLQSSQESKSKTRRSGRRRRGKSSTSETDTATATEVQDTAAQEEAPAEEPKPESPQEAEATTADEDTPAASKADTDSDADKPDDQDTEKKE